MRGSDRNGTLAVRLDADRVDGEDIGRKVDRSSWLRADDVPPDGIRGTSYSIIDSSSCIS